MIIKSSRIPVSDTGAIAAYFAAEGENEEISWLQGSAAEIKLMGVTAKLAGRAFSVRHVIVAPGAKLSGNELGQILDNVCAEYGVTENMRDRITAVVHKKRARAGLASSITITSRFPKWIQRPAESWIPGSPICAMKSYRA